MENTIELILGPKLLRVCFILFWLSDFFLKKTYLLTNLKDQHRERQRKIPSLHWFIPQIITQPVPGQVEPGM